MRREVWEIGLSLFDIIPQIQLSWSRNIHNRGKITKMMIKLKHTVLLELFFVISIIPTKIIKISVNYIKIYKP